MKVAIVGAGVSGLSAAHFLLEKAPELEITIFEKTPQLGGRMSTQVILPDTRVDTGCQFLSLDQERLREFFLSFKDRVQIRELPLSILCLPDAFLVEAKGRYFITEGMRGWCEALFEDLQKRSNNIELKLETQIGSLQPLIEAGYDRILISAPGAGSKHLGAKESVEYHPCLSLVFSWFEAPPEALEHYAYRDISSREGLNWLAHEGLKRGRQGLWLAQLSPEKSKELSTCDTEEIEDFLEADMREWIPLFEEGEKTLLQHTFWRQAFPIQFGDFSVAEAFERESLASGQRIYYFGDGYRGVGRSENAMESALAVAINCLIEDELSQAEGEGSSVD